MFMVECTFCDDVLFYIFACVEKNISLKCNHKLDVCTLFTKTRAYTRVPTWRIRNTQQRKQHEAL